MPKALIAASGLARLIFFGNHFYGICAAALSIEASTQQQLPLNSWEFYLLLYCAVVWYYNEAYLHSEAPAGVSARSDWYAANRSKLRVLQFFLAAITVLMIIIIGIRNLTAILRLPLYAWLLLGAFPLSAAAYYGIQIGSRRLVLRNLGWLKPFLIGFTWSGMVTVYSSMFYALAHNIDFSPDFFMLFLFIKNMMFVSVLCILFDIKDYEMDYNLQLKTFAVKLGLKKTIYYLIIPLCIAGFLSFLVFAQIRGFHTVRVVLNAIPFIGVIVVSAILHARRSIFYYLVIIDGLMLLKAICGITGSAFG